MSLISLVLILIVIGVALFYVPMEPRIKTIAVIVVAVVVGILLIDMLGGLGHFGDIRIGR